MNGSIYFCINRTLSNTNGLNVAVTDITIFLSALTYITFPLSAMAELIFFFYQ